MRFRAHLAEHSSGVEFQCLGCWRGSKGWSLETSCDAVGDGKKCSWVVVLEKWMGKGK